MESDLDHEVDSLIIARYPNYNCCHYEFAPLLYLGAVLLELNCKAQALHVYRAIPYVRPVVKSTYPTEREPSTLAAVAAVAAGERQPAP